MFAQVVVVSILARCCSSETERLQRCVQEFFTVLMSFQADFLSRAWSTDYCISRCVVAGGWTSIPCKCVRWSCSGLITLRHSIEIARDATQYTKVFNIKGTCGFAYADTTMHTCCVEPSQNIALTGQAYSINYRAMVIGFSFTMMACLKRIC